MRKTRHINNKERVCAGRRTATVNARYELHIKCVLSFSHTLNPEKKAYQTNNRYSNQDVQSGAAFDSGGMKFMRLYVPMAPLSNSTSYLKK